MQKFHRYPLVLAFVFSLVLGACQAAASPQPAQPPSQSPVSPTPTPPLVVLLDNDEGPLTPANFNTFIGYWVTGWIYDGLFRLSPELEPVPSLATEATPSEDGLAWTVKLRQDVKWHDGQPFTAQDVIFSYQFLVEAGRAQALTVIESMEAQGDYQLTLKLKQPAPFFLSEGLASTYIMPEHIWKDQQPVSGELSQFQGKIGTGAYKLVEVTPGESYVFEANPGYFAGKPRVEQIIAKIVKDRTQQINQLKTGQAGAVLSSVPPALAKDLEGDPNIKLAQGSDFFNYVFYVNGSRPPFDQVEVRKAFSMAVDKGKLVETVMLGSGTVLPLSYYHPDLPWSIKIESTYDPQAARTLLDQAGLKDTDGDGIREYNGNPMEYEMLCDANNPVEIRSTELIAGWLKEAGVAVTPKCMDIDTVVSFIWPNFVSVPNPDYDLSIFGWSSGPQFQRGFIQFLTNGDFGGLGWANLTGTSDSQLDKLIADLVSNPDPAQQEALNRQVQERFAEVMLFIPLLSPGGNFAYLPSAYDGWVYTRGTGIMTVWSFLP